MMRKRLYIFSICFCLLLSVQCSALTIEKVSYKTPVNGIGKQIRVTLGETDGQKDVVGDNIFFIAQYSLNGRLLNLKTCSVATGEMSPADPGFRVPIIPETLPVRVKIFAWSSLTDVVPVSNCYDLIVSSTNEIFQDEMPDFLKEFQTFRVSPGDEYQLKMLILNVGNQIKEEMETFDMTRSYLETRFAAEIAEAKAIYNGMEKDKQASFNERLTNFTTDHGFQRLRTCLLEMFGFI